MIGVLGACPSAWPGPGTGTLKDWQTLGQATARGIVGPKGNFSERRIQVQATGTPFPKRETVLLKLSADDLFPQPPPQIWINPPSRVGLAGLFGFGASIFNPGKTDVHVRMRTTLVGNTGNVYLTIRPRSYGNVTLQRIDYCDTHNEFPIELVIACDGDVAVIDPSLWFVALGEYFDRLSAPGIPPPPALPR